MKLSAAPRNCWRRGDMRKEVVTRLAASRRRVMVPPVMMARARSFPSLPGLRTEVRRPADPGSASVSSSS